MSVQDVVEGRLRAVARRRITAKVQRVVGVVAGFRSHVGVVLRVVGRRRGRSADGIAELVARVIVTSRRLQK